MYIGWTTIRIVKKGKLKGALVAISGLVQDSYESKTFAKVILELLSSFDVAMSKHSCSNDIYVYVYSFLFNLNVKYYIIHFL